MKHLHVKSVCNNYGVTFRYPVCSFPPTHSSRFYLLPMSVKCISSDTLSMLFLGMDHPSYWLWKMPKSKYKAIYEKSQDSICNYIHTDTWFLFMDEAYNEVKHLKKFLDMQILIEKTIVFGWCMVGFSGIYQV